MKATGPHDARRRNRNDVRPISAAEISLPPSPHISLPDTGAASQKTGIGRRFPASDHDLTVVVPAYNEEQRLPATLEGLAGYFDRWGVDYRILVVDDGSRDGTARLTDGRGFRFQTISQPNRGKGAAVRNGMLQATGRVIAFTDADLPYDLAGVRAAYESIRARESEIVFGARDLRESAVLAPRRLVRTFATHVFRALMRILVSRQITDTQCGLKVFSRQAALEVFTRTQIDGFAFDAEVVYLTHRLGLLYGRIPVTLINEYASTISLSRHALPMLLDVLRVRHRSWRGEYEFDSATPIVIEPQPADPVQAAA
jgi:dolichyl-phosphate beta-glucosyltransferase